MESYAVAKVASVGYDHAVPFRHLSDLLCDAVHGTNPRG